MHKFTLSLDLALAQLDEIALIAHPQFNFQLFYSIGMFVTGILLFRVIGMIIMIASSVWAVISVHRFKRKRKFRRVFFSPSDIKVKICTLTDKIVEKKQNSAPVYRLIFGEKSTSGKNAVPLSVDVDSYDYENAVLHGICYVAYGRAKSFCAQYAFPSSIYIPDTDVLAMTKASFPSHYDNE